MRHLLNYKFKSKQNLVYRAKKQNNILQHRLVSEKNQTIIGAIFMPGWRWEFAEAEKIQADKIQGKGQPL